MRWVKPLDEKLIRQLSQSHKLIVTLEENSIAGGAGSAVSEFLSSEGIVIPVMQLGLPDYFRIVHSIQSRMDLLFAKKNKKVF